MGVAGDVAAPKTADEVSRIEKLGMIVTVVSAKSRSEMERYLQTQGINPTTVDLSSLDGYFGEEGYAFVSGWVAKRSEPVQATGLKIIFPSPTIWFPLKPTRVYTDPVETVVYVRGFVKPADGCDLPNLKCEYVYADIKKKGVQETFRRDDPLDPRITTILLPRKSSPVSPLQPTRSSGTAIWNWFQERTLRVLLP